MLVPDGGPERGELIDWADLETSLGNSALIAETEALQSIIARNNALAQEAEASHLMRVYDGRLHDLPQLTATDNGNTLCVAIPLRSTSTSATMPIGYFSPVDEGFVMYEELVTPEEASILSFAASQARERDIHNFNQTTVSNRERMDFADPVVRDIHRQHNEYLNTGGVQLIGILDSFRRMLGTSSGANVKFLEADAQTQASISLQAMGDYKDRCVRLRVIGGFVFRNGVKVRERQPYFIDIAQKTGSLQDEMSEYVAKESCGLTDGEVGELVDMAHDLIATREVMQEFDGIKLDTIHVAIARKPENVIPDYGD